MWPISLNKVSVVVSVNLAHVSTLQRQHSACVHMNIIIQLQFERDETQIHILLLTSAHLCWRFLLTSDIYK